MDASKRFIVGPNPMWMEPDEEDDYEDDEFDVTFDTEILE
jgi:hypothetical protein